MEAAFEPLFFAKKRGLGQPSKKGIKEIDYDKRGSKSGRKG